jgi:hypothetical protein
MPVTPLPNHLGHAFIRVALTGDNEPMEFGFHYDATAATGDANAHANTIRSTWFASFGAGDMNTSYTFLGVRVLEGNGTSAPDPGTSDVAVVGTFAVAPPPQNVAYLLHKRSGLAGRNHNGRCYMPPAYSLAESDITATGAIPAGSVTAINTKLSTVRSALSTANLPMVVWSPTTGAVSTVASFTIDPIVATRRRRLRR